ncbi:MAG: DUF3995 domain-containing protein [Saprospiraceae bacterium]
MITMVGLILVLIFLILSLFHFYWSFGGKKGREAAIPNSMDGSKLFNPGFLSTMVVAVGLLSFALYVLIKINLLTVHIPDWILRYGLIAIALIFILRAIGDFKYIGFFATIKPSDKFGKPSQFAIMDKKYYSPLCLLIGILGLIIEVMQ